MSDVRYGLKLSSNWTTSDRWQSLRGPGVSFARRLADWGVGFIELALGETTPPENLLRSAEPLAEAGLGLSVHPYVRDHLAPEAWNPDVAGEAMLTMLKSCDTLADLTGRPVPMVYHAGLAGLDPHDVPLDIATERGHLYTQWIGEQIAAHELRVEPYCETQMPFAPKDRKHVRIGDTWPCCMQLIDGTDVNLCWDLGHGYLSASYGFHTAFPPEEFLDRVGHVHAHDVERRGKDEFVDHRPLGQGEAPWFDYLHLLADRHFSGWVLFEIDLLDYETPGGVEAMFRRSVKLADEALDNGRPETPGDEGK